MSNNVTPEQNDRSATASRKNLDNSRERSSSIPALKEGAPNGETNQNKTNYAYPQTVNQFTTGSDRI